MKARLWSLITSLILSAVSCGHGNNLLLGRAESHLGTHAVVVTDCYRIRVPQPQASGARMNWEPCRDARILIADEALTVNGTSYGHLNPADPVLVDHGVVSVGSAAEQTQK